MGSPILEVRNLRKDYDEGRIEALRGVDLSINAGEFVAISGHSGSGKSTLLHLLGGLDTPTSGDVVFRGAPLGSSISLDTYRCHHVGFIFQAFYLLPTLCAVENVQAPMLATEDGAGNRYERADAPLGRGAGEAGRCDERAGWPVPLQLRGVGPPESRPMRGLAFMRLRAPFEQSSVSARS